MKAKILVGLRICLIVCTLIAAGSLSSSSYGEQPAIHDGAIETRSLDASFPKTVQIKSPGREIQVGELLQSSTTVNSRMDNSKDDYTGNKENVPHTDTNEKKVSGGPETMNATKYESFRFPPQRMEGKHPNRNKNYNWNHLATHPEATNMSFKIPNDATKQRIHYSQLPYCLRGPMYGLANNRVLSLARMLHRGVEKQRPIALSKKISDWYRLFFDDHPMFWLDYYEDEKTPCFKTNRPEQAYRLNEQAICIPELTTELLPKSQVRQMAERILQEQILIPRHLLQQEQQQQQRQHSPAPSKSKFVAIHRRNFEGACMRRAGRHHVAKDFCPRDEGRRHCKLVYDSVRDHYKTSSNNTSTTSTDNGEDEHNIWLFTDGQEPTLDATFPKIFNATRDYDVDESTALFLEMWLMTLADEHWGHTESTVDVVVWHWRQYQNTFPQNCFVPNPPAGCVWAKTKY